MKLSKKGFYKILNTCSFDEELAKYSLKYSDCNKDYFFEVEEVDFEPDDFEGVVYLSIEEAQAIRSKLCDLLLFAKGKDRYQSNVKKDLSLLWGRIIQAEGKK